MAGLTMHSVTLMTSQALDLTGHGRTAGTAGFGAHIDSWERLVDDAEDMFRCFPSPPPLATSRLSNQQSGWWAVRKL
jgi:hypothetical protein